jgi:hypothetical protein
MFTQFWEGKGKGNQAIGNHLSVFFGPGGHKGSYSHLGDFEVLRYLYALADPF